MKSENLFIRKCPSCGKEISYARKSDFNKAERLQTECKSCAVKKSSIFKKGHTLNDSVVRKNTLDNLLEQTPQSFYWLGFILADGSFYNNGKFELGLAEKDKEVIEEFSKFIDYKNKIMYRKDTKSYRISFANSISIPKFMEKYDIHYRKTYNPINFENYKQYDKLLLWSLLIGIIDGDGHISNNGSSGAFVITITAHKSWEQFYKDIFEWLDIPEHIKEYSSKTTLTIRIYRKDIIQHMCNIIINNNLFYLKRKWQQILMRKGPLAS